jgi:hypothetical protein
MSFRALNRSLRWAGYLLLTAVALYAAVLNLPGLLFPYHVTQGRLTLYSDEPIEGAPAVLRDAQARIETSPIDDHRPHRVAIATSEWRRKLVFTIEGGAAGVNYHPLTGVVYLRHADIGQNQLYGAAGKPAAPPRTLSYYMAHEITHSLTGERLGPLHIWNRRLPQWVREGYADYVGMGGKVDVADLYRREKAGDPDLSFARTHTYAEFRLLAAYFLQDRGWTVDQLLASKLTKAQAQAAMEASPPKL